MSNFSGFSRCKFLTTAAASGVSAVLLKACGNPPEPGGGATATEQVQAADISPEMMPETTKAVLGYIPIVEATPLVIAKERGFFAKYGSMTDVEIPKQANWASARDNVTIASQGGGIDGGQWQMPMPHLISCTWEFECQFLD